MSNLQYTAILWDWDGTLVDSFGAIHAAYNATLKAFDMPAWTLEETHRNVALSGRDMFPALFGSNAEKAARIYIDTYAKVAPGLVRPKPGRRDLLVRLHGAGVPMGVVSNKRGPVLRRECEALGWVDLFLTLVGAGDAARDKPDIAPMRLAAAEAGFRLGAEVLYIGDGPVDGKGAANAGLTALLLAGETHNAAELKPHAPHVLSFVQLEDALFTGQFVGTKAQPLA